MRAPITQNSTYGVHLVNPPRNLTSPRVASHPRPPHPLFNVGRRDNSCCEEQRRPHNFPFQLWFGGQGGGLTVSQWKKAAGAGETRTKKSMVSELFQSRVGALLASLCERTESVVSENGSANTIMRRCPFLQFCLRASLLCFFLVRGEGKLSFLGGG